MFIIHQAWLVALVLAASPDKPASGPSAEEMAEPTMVRLDFKGKSMLEILASLQEQSGLSMVLPDAPSEPEKLILHAPEPVPFWEAVERLCQVRGLGVGFRSPDGTTYPSVYLASYSERPPMSVSGPFLVELRGLHHHRDLTLTGGPWLREDSMGQRPSVPHSVEALARDQRFYADLSVRVEPRMWFAQTGPAKVIEAVDDRGQSLKRPGGQEVAYRTFFPSNGDTYQHAKLPLLYPEHAGSTIKRLKGVMPVVLERREPEPAWTVPLDDFKGRTFHDGGLVLEVVKVAPDGQETQIVLSMTADEDSPLAGEEQRLSVYALDLMRRQVKIVDAKGRVVQDYGSGTTDRIRFWAGPKEGSGPAATLIYYRMVRVETEVEFEFTDLPMP